jgi:hypothetical protein
MTPIYRYCSALFLTIVAVPLFAADEVRAVRLPAATLVELAAVPAPPPMARETRHREERPVPRGALSDSGAAGAQARIEAGAASITTPPIAAAFDADTSHNLSPADASGAVSRTHAVSASNAGILVQNRAGATVVRLTLSQFWRNTNTVAEFYDPRLVYDAAANRWVTIAVRDARSLMLAVSANGDPTGIWMRYELPVSNCDYTRLALTRDTVVLNTFQDDFIGAFFSVSKAVLYPGPSQLSLKQYLYDLDLFPADSPDSDAEYVVESGDSGIGFMRLGENVLHQVSAGFSWTYPDSDRASQAGTSNRLDLGFGDVQAAVYRGGFLYAVHRIGTSVHSADGNALLWWKVDPTGAIPPVTGIIDAPAASTILAYPSLAVNRNGAMLITYCALSATTWPSSEYLYRDAAGRVGAPVVIASGNSPILNTDRWGDYTTTVVDPLNDTDFWAMQIYANHNDWQSRWTNVKLPLGKVRAVRTR